MVCGTTPKDERDASIAGLADGTVEVLTSCALIDEGLDIPAVSCVILLRPTKSLVLHRQQIGRGMRPAPSKTLIILDHVGNSIQHGFARDENRVVPERHQKAQGKDAHMALPTLRGAQRTIIRHLLGMRRGQAWITAQGSN